MTSKSNKKGKEALHLYQTPRWTFLVRAKAFNLPAWKALLSGSAFCFSISQVLRSLTSITFAKAERRARNAQQGQSRCQGDARCCRWYRRLFQGKEHWLQQRGIISSLPPQHLFLTSFWQVSRVGNLPALVNSLSNHIACIWKALQEVEYRLGDHTESSSPINHEDGEKAFKGGQACIKRETTLKELPKSALGSQGEEEMETKVTWKAILPSVPLSSSS